MRWGLTALWGIESLWGIEPGAGEVEYCALADKRVLIQMGTETGNRNFRDYICISVEPMGEFQDVAEDVASAFVIDTAVGVQLDMIGAVIGLPRQGFSDSRYKDFLNIQVELILSHQREEANWTGTVNNVLTITRTFVGVGPVITLTNVPPYAFTMTIPGLVASEVPVLMGFL